VHTVSRETLDAIIDEGSHIVIGQRALIEKLLIVLLSDGHVLLEGTPSLAKTQLISALGKVTGGSFKRIQLLPDLMPSDVTGTLVYHPDERAFRVQNGPIIDTHFLLPDEINCIPPKVQATFLQAMQEREVTLGTEIYRLFDPFIVIATHNPIEEEGMYPLPKAQLDCFLFQLLVAYPDEYDVSDHHDMLRSLYARPLGNWKRDTTDYFNVSLLSTEHARETSWIGGTHS
jgi:MoxR-like ATPase